jgi:hypothetical protein
MKIDNEYKIGQEVYLICDADQYKRKVVYIVVYDQALLAYGLSCNGETSEHWALEISQDKQVI